MITTEWATEFAREWIEAWNSHDLERILAHYMDDFSMTSPFVTLFTTEPSGTLHGKEQIGDYWRVALERLPDLHFELLGVFTGVDSIAIYYKAAPGTLATEVLCFNEQRQVCRAFARYAH